MPIIKISIAVLLLTVFLTIGYFGYKNTPTKPQKDIPQETTIAKKSEQDSVFATNTGKFCELTSQYGGGTTLYYTDGNKYFLSSALNYKTAKMQTTLNILFTGTNYYMWTDPASEALAATTYSAEEAHNSSLDDSVQLREVIDHPEKCTTWKVDPQKFTPPTNISFTNTQQMMDQMKQLSEENAKKVCKLCIEQFKTKKEQIDCFSTGAVFSQTPRDVIEKEFETYCN